MKRRALLVGLLASALAATAFAAERQLVLVAAQGSAATTLAPAEVRKLFLGGAVEVNGQRLEPLVNASDELLHEVFLQKVVFMAARSYDRHVLGLVFRSGGHRPARYTSTEELVQALAREPRAVTYMWADQARRLRGVKIVQELWHGRLD